MIGNAEAVMETIIVAIISGLCVAIPSVIATIVNNKATSETTLFRIQELEKKQDKHNQLIERQFRLEERVSVIEAELKREAGND